MNWTVYLSGEIHTDWRDRIREGATSRGLPVTFSSAVTDHAASDAAGDVLGTESDAFWRDHKSSKVNGIRTRTLLDKCDIAVVRFGEKYKQWNAAFDAGYASALGKPIIVLSMPEHQHALKEVHAASLAVAEEPEQVVDILRYTLTGALPS
jgi:YtoQ family protein